ncbi:hypothetical protein [Treponema zioleckii]|uniref:hypothetical protein n=1 Tax=Treponema zioleckii TaxID=331680 RepID=UPI00168ACCA8|nr:hypothetical protein [Treponema zioleckii]
MKKLVLVLAVLLAIIGSVAALAYRNFTVIAKCRFCYQKQTINVSHVLEDDYGDAETQAAELFDNHSSTCPAPYSGSIDIINSWQN